MDINKKRALEAKLQMMFAQSCQDKVEKPIMEKQTGSIIRRRKGFPDKRLNVI